MTTDDTAPATRGDLMHFTEQIMTALTDMENRMENRIEEQLDERIRESEERMKHHFDVVAENIRHDFQGAFKDKLEQHDNRITLLEEHAGLARV